MARGFTRLGAGLLLSATVTGCRTPALIVDQTAEGRSELAAAVSEALQGQPILLSEDALTAMPMLVIERRSARDANGLALNGRELSKPQVFRLYLRSGHCLLVHLATQREWRLHQTRCVIAKG